jgi:hypothetical protein
MFEGFTWRQGSGESDVISRFADLARKASEEAGAEVLVVLNFPQGYRAVVASTQDLPARQDRIMTPRAVAKGVELLFQWLRGYREGGYEIQKEIDRLNAIRKCGRVDG